MNDDPFIKTRVASGISMVINGIGKFVYLAGLHRDPEVPHSPKLNYILSELDTYLIKNGQPRFGRTIAIAGDENLVYLEGGTGINAEILRRFEVET